MGYDSNVLGSGASARQLDIGTPPSLPVGSDWSRNSLVGFLGLDDWRYLDQPHQSRTNWTASFGGTLAVGRDQLTVAAAHFTLHQDRTGSMHCRRMRRSATTWTMCGPPTRLAEPCVGDAEPGILGISL